MTYATLPATVTATVRSALQHIHSGKVRDLYADGDDLILVASDRMSIYDVVLPTPIPDKGGILTQLSLWWFGQLADIVPNHVISASDVPPEWAGPGVLAAQRRERARIRSERQQRWGRPKPEAA
jgi:phosphoribosylaminoimidazole-succinocarboxamide synthase